MLAPRIRFFGERRSFANEGGSTGASGALVAPFAEIRTRPYHSGVPLHTLVDGVWIDSDPVSIVGMPLTATMTILRLPDGAVALHSPVSMTDERRAEVDRLGPVTHLIAPSLFHHRWIGEWAGAYPSATLHVPPGLPKKRPDLRAARVIGEDTDPSLAGTIDFERIDGFRLNEIAVHYRPARLLIVADLVHNVGRPEGAWARFYTKTMGFYDRVALSKMIRSTAFSDRAAARKSIDRILAWQPERLVVGHGTPVMENVTQTLTAALDWLQ